MGYRAPYIDICQAKGTDRDASQLNLKQLGNVGEIFFITQKKRDGYIT